MKTRYCRKCDRHLAMDNFSTTGHICFECKRAAAVAADLTYRTPAGDSPDILIEQACAGAGLL